MSIRGSSKLSSSSSWQCRQVWQVGSRMLAAKAWMNVWTAAAVACQGLWFCVGPNC